MIGIVGGVGPYAGLDLVRKIFDETIASGDQEHLPVILMSLPGEIEDRTGFLLGKSQKNPAYSISRILSMLARARATVVGIPCNTAHAPEIFYLVEKSAQKVKPRLKLLNLIEETASYLSTVAPAAKLIGVLSTTGTRRVGIYRKTLEKKGLTVIELSEDSQENLVQSAIYDAEYGIKAKSDPVTPIARTKIEDAMDVLRKQGAEVIILGCTELPLAITENSFNGVPLIDPARALARALIKEVDASKLRPL